jgi:hypothetical protein
VYTLQDDFQHGVEPTDVQTFSMYGVTDFSLQYWNGGAWVSLATVSGNNHIKRSATFSPVTTTKIRVVISGSYSSYSRLVEIEAWGIAAAPTPDLRLATLTGESNGTLLALNNARLNAPSSFAVTSPENPGDDKWTRIMIFAEGVVGLAQNTDPTNDIVVEGVTVPNLAESVVVEARTQNGQVYNLPVEFVGGWSLIDNLDSINVRLIPELQGAGVVELKILVDGRSSNAATIVVQ